MCENVLPEFGHKYQSDHTWEKVSTSCIFLRPLYASCTQYMSGK